MTQSSTVVTETTRRQKRAEGRSRRALRLKQDPEFAKQYFAGKSKRSADKKSAFKKKKNRKK